MLLVVALLPIFLLGLYIYKKDREKESSKLLFKLFLSGMFSCVPSILLGLFLTSFFPPEDEMNFIQMFLYVFIAIALVEELCKWYFVKKISYNHEEFDTVYDMIVYASFTALGFACLENILYVYTSGIMVGIMRAISAVPGHVCDGVLMGLYLGFSKVSFVRGDIRQSKKHLVLSLVVPVITHGIYDFCLFWESDLLLLLFIIFIIFLYIVCLKNIKKMSVNNIKFKYKDNYCSVCGYPVNSEFCPRCGRKNK